MDDSSIPAPIDEGQGTNKGDDLNCCGKRPSLRKAGLTGSCSLPEQLGMSPSSTITPKPLAPSVYVHVPEAPSPHERSISVMSLFPSLMVWRSHRDKSHVLDELDAVHHFFGFINLPDEQQARDDLPDAAGLLS